jgi:hypothetical protein
MKLLILVLMITVPRLMTAQVPNYVSSSDLVGWWPFTGNADDESSFNNNGVVSGASLVNDRHGNSNSAFSFDGIDDLIEIADDSSLRFEMSNQLSISLWFNCGVVNPPVEPFVTKGLMLGPGFKVILGNHQWGQDLSAITRDDSGPNTTVREDGDDYTDFNWHHLVYTFDNGSCTLYLNDSIVDVDTIAGANVRDTSLALIFGALPFDGNPYFYGGVLDDIGIWTRALSQSEVSSLFSESLVGISEINDQKPKELLKVVDVLGREIKPRSGVVLIYIYSDGSTDKVFRID